MPKKKVVFVLVEGPSDETALAPFFKTLYDPNEVYVYVEGGDITSQTDVTSGNIINKVAFRVKDYAKKHKIHNTDFERIIHIVDTDGTFIPGDKVEFDSCCQKTHYELEFIKTANVNRILLRNRNKKNNVSKLGSVNHIWEIPYKVYYMSCNLDHVLYNKLNSTDDEKEFDSLDFYEKYENDYKGFVDFLCNSDFSVNMSYKDSWKYIEQGLNSLNRHTNVNLCFAPNSTV